MEAGAWSGACWLPKRLQHCEMPASLCANPFSQSGLRRRTGVWEIDDCSGQPWQCSCSSDGKAGTSTPSSGPTVARYGSLVVLTCTPARGNFLVKESHDSRINLQVRKPA
jgi:hypothetical protein